MRDIGRKDQKSGAAVCVALGERKRKTRLSLAARAFGILRIATTEPRFSAVFDGKGDRNDV